MLALSTIEPVKLIWRADFTVSSGEGCKNAHPGWKSQLMKCDRHTHETLSEEGLRHKNLAQRNALSVPKNVCWVILRFDLPKAIEVGTPIGGCPVRQVQVAIVYISRPGDVGAHRGIHLRHGCETSRSI